MTWRRQRCAVRVARVGKKTAYSILVGNVLGNINFQDLKGNGNIKIKLNLSGRL
jgi:hypothetical protein